MSKIPKTSAPSPRRTSIAWLLSPIVLAAIPFAWGKYLEFSIDGPFDSSMYVYSAKCVQNGMAVHKDFPASTRPATLLVNFIGVSIFGYSEVGPKIIQTLMQLGALALMFYTLRLNYGTLPASVALILAAFFLSCPPFAKYGNVKEQYMIACMIVTACGLMLHHSGKSWRWLLLSAGAAANIYFFKATGVSVIIAMLVYIVLQPILRHRSFKQTGADVLGLFLGAFIGLIPLMVFFAWQGELTYLLKKIPLLSSLIGHLTHTPTSSLQDILSGGDYIQEAKKVSIFATQYDTVVGYYRSFISPIGFSCLAIVWGLIDLIRKPFQPKIASGGAPILDVNTGYIVHGKPAGGRPEFFLPLLAVWWILDMLFVWISPRSYVEYYLPLNSSSAFLAAWAVWRCQKNLRGYAMLILAWLLADLVLTWLVISPSSPYFLWRSTGLEHNWWWFLWRSIPLVAALAVAIIFRKTPYRKLSAIILPLIAVGTALWWMTPNIVKFWQEVNNQRQLNRENRLQLWEQAADYVRNNSQHNDGLYVWGWYPGIYVRAKRFCPVYDPAYGDMHATSPVLLKKYMDTLVQQLQKNPPKFIVDPQHQHYPFYTHPNFDLWPLSLDKNGKLQFISPNPQSVKAHSEFLDDEVEKYTFMNLTNPRRKGGPVAEDKAKILAHDEKLRHQAMLPLRLFVTQNYKPAYNLMSPSYQPLSTHNAGMLVFVHKE
jgi:hypothetical protein